MRYPRESWTKAEAIKLFWSKVNIGNDRASCWLWMASRNSKGYGKFVSIFFKSGRAHRIAYELHSGRKIPKRKLVCHRCDNPPCCNPEHLFLGTAADNTSDAVAKNRIAHGEHHTCSKLTNLAAREILASRKSQRWLAKKYGVSTGAIWQVLHGKSWRRTS